jgi:hypothetical protein
MNINKASHSVILNCMLGFIALSASMFAGLGLDDFSNLLIYRTTPIVNIVANPMYNRFPAFGFMFLPTLLSMPLMAAHLLVSMVHVINGCLVILILRKFEFNYSVAVLSGMLFTVAPASIEPVMWLSASTVVFGLLFLLSGALIFMKTNHKFVGLVIFALSVTFSEGFLIPGQYFLLCLVLYAYKKISFKSVLYFSYPAVFFLLMQLVRYSINTGGQLTQYKTGLDFNTFKQNFTHLVQLSIGLRSSGDTSWLWDYLATSNSTLFLPLALILPALGVTGAITYFLIKQQASPLSSLKDFCTWVLLSLAGYLSAFTTFLIVTGNAMQARYTYSALPFLATFVALLVLAPFTLKPLTLHKSLKSFSFVIIIGMLTFNLYYSWSNMYDFYIANNINKKFIDAFQKIQADYDIQTLYVVNDTKVVGNAFTLARDWAYNAAGILYVDPDLAITSDSLIDTLNKTDLVSSQTFTQKNCLFMTWHEGELLVDTTALWYDEQTVLDCKMGTVVKLGSNPPPAIQFQRYPTSKHLITQMPNSP